MRGYSEYLTHISICVSILLEYSNHRLEDFVMGTISETATLSLSERFDTAKRNIQNIPFLDLGIVLYKTTSDEKRLGIMPESVQALLMLRGELRITLTKTRRSNLLREISTLTKWQATIGTAITEIIVETFPESIDELFYFRKGPWLSPPIVVLKKRMVH